MGGGGIGRGSIWGDDCTLTFPQVSINGVLLSTTLPASTLAHTTAVEALTEGGTNGYVVNRAEHYRLKGQWILKSSIVLLIK